MDRLIKIFIKFAFGLILFILVFQTVNVEYSVSCVSSYYDMVRIIGNGSWFFIPLLFVSGLFFGSFINDFRNFIKESIRCMTKGKIIMNLKKYDLSRWEIDILNEFNEIKPLDELLENVFADNWEDFLINLADGLNTWKSKM